MEEGWLYTFCGDQRASRCNLQMTCGYAADCSICEFPKPRARHLDITWEEKNTDVDRYGRITKKPSAQLRQRPKQQKTTAEGRGKASVWSKSNFRWYMSRIEEIKVTMLPR